MDAEQLRRRNTNIAVMNMLTALSMFLVYANEVEPGQGEKRRRCRRWWVRPIYERRLSQGDYHNLIQEMRLTDQEMFFNYTRMTIKIFDKLLSIVGPTITPRSNRPSISAGCRLAITLRLLASGDSLQSIAFAFRIGKSTVCMITRETCEALWIVLQPRYLPIPSEDNWIRIADEYRCRWQLPNCLGAIDGKHVKIKSPNKSGTLYYNYKKTYSIVLFGVCDANNFFTYVNIGAYGSQSDGGVLRESSFGYHLKNGTLNIPQDAALPGTTTKVPFFFVGDEAFPLQKHLLRPYGGRYLSLEENIYNYRLARGRRGIENVFGALAARWQIYHKTINAFPENVDKIIKATVCLHNYIKTEEANVSPNNRKYCNEAFEDREMQNGEVNLGAWRQDVSRNSSLRRLGARNAGQEAIAFRNYLKQYFVGIGSVNW